MKVIDLFAGMKGWSSAFADRGHETWTTDFDDRFDVSLVKDILKITRDDLPWEPGTPGLVILASPPCEGFSVMNIGRNWTGPKDDPPHQPKTDTARLALRLVERTRQIISVMRPEYFIIENPRAKLRKLPVVEDLERRGITYCQYGDLGANGEPRMKPTDSR